jgi:hypothetical protein
VLRTGLAATSRRAVAAFERRRKPPSEGGTASTIVIRHHDHISILRLIYYHTSKSCQLNLNTIHTRQPAACVILTNAQFRPGGTWEHSPVASAPGHAPPPPESRRDDGTLFAFIAAFSHTPHRIDSGGSEAGALDRIHPPSSDYGGTSRINRIKGIQGKAGRRTRLRTGLAAT